MNLHLPSPRAIERRGLRLQAMLATRTEGNLYFKLNLGATRQGVVSRPDALVRFQDLQFGEIVDCWVSAWSTGGNIVFLERLEATTPIPEPPEPIVGKCDRWRRRQRGY
mmetsp:Transcript_23368/g.51611  ORF Transcript_23368/g.51611 Transcript_23368/m.51611 type:complete len:109 (-) Transcript_23368:78-404(-)